LRAEKRKRMSVIKKFKENRKAPTPPKAKKIADWLRVGFVVLTGIGTAATMMTGIGIPAAVGIATLSVAGGLKAAEEALRQQVYTPKGDINNTNK
jgi:hypothetical protein